MDSVSIIEQNLSPDELSVITLIRIEESNRITILGVNTQRQHIHLIQSEVNPTAHHDWFSISDKTPYLFVEQEELIMLPSEEKENQTDWIKILSKHKETEPKQYPVDKESEILLVGFGDKVPFPLGYLQYLYAQYNSSGSKQAHIYFRDDAQITVIAFNNEFRFANQYPIENKEDCLYFLTAISQECGLNPTQENYYYSGFPSEEMIAFLKGYYPNLQKENTPYSFSYCDEMKEAIVETFLPHICTLCVL